MTTVNERLEELLDLKDQELGAERARCEALERQIRLGVDWMLHERIEEGADTLPVPRIEMRLTDNSDFHAESQVSLVIAERGGMRSRVPLGYSKRSGGGVRVEHFPVSGELASQFITALPGILHDACFYAEQTGLPAYLVLDDDHRYEITALRPSLRMRSV